MHIFLGKTVCIQKIRRNTGKKMIINTLRLYVESQIVARFNICLQLVFSYKGIHLPVSFLQEGFPNF